MVVPTWRGPTNALRGTRGGGWWVARRGRRRDHAV